MSHFYGTINGKAKNQATQCGSKNSGMITQAASWDGAIQVELVVNKYGQNGFNVRQIPWQGSGISELITSGVVGQSMKVEPSYSDLKKRVAELEREVRHLDPNLNG